MATDIAAEQALLPAGFVQRVRDEAARLSPGTPAAGQLRQSALEQVAALGLPGLRDNDWRHANLKRVGRARLAAAVPSAGSTADLPPPVAGFPRLTLVNGQPSEALSDAEAWAGLEPDTTAAAIPAPVDAAVPRGALRFALLCDALAPRRLRLKLRDGQSVEVLHLLQPASDGGALYPHLRVEVEAGATASMVERHCGGAGSSAFSCALLAIDVAAGGVLNCLRLFAGAEDAHALDHLQARLGDEARLELVGVDTGGESVHHGMDLRLEGRGAAASVDLLLLGHGQRTVDARIDITHLGPGTTSRQCVRAIANGRSTLSTSSRVEVLASAPGSQSRQSLKGLLGDRGATVNLRPQLEILTDEVQASHGATTGALDEDMLFYLLSRGLDAATARQLLEWAFAGDVLARIQPQALRREIERDALSRMDNSAAREAIA